MKKVIILAVATSALLAGPTIGNIVDYDARDYYLADRQAQNEYIQSAVRKPVVVTAPAIVTTIVKQENCKNCCPDRDSVDLMAGYNFTEDDGALDDAGTLGIRYNKNIAHNTYIQLGYDRVFNADYRKHKIVRTERSISGEGAAGADGSNSVGGDSNNYNRPSDSNSLSASKSSNNSASTQLDRFYLNGMYEFCSDKKLTPYVVGGLGYENVRHESSSLESGAFINAGAGVKYQINEDLNLITEAKALRRFDNDDIDIMAGVGIGMMFGAGNAQNIPTSELEASTTKREVIPSIIESTTLTPVASSSYATVQRVPGPSKYYDSLDVVPIETESQFRTRAVLNEHLNSRRYNARSINSAHNTSGNYYIQIAALFSSNGQDASYLSKLDNAGLNYKFKNTNVKGRNVKLLVVGPYNSRNAASADLSRAKSVTRGAFIKKING